MYTPIAIPEFTLSVTSVMYSFLYLGLVSMLAAGCLLIFVFLEELLDTKPSLWVAWLAFIVGLVLIANTTIIP